MKRNLLVLFLLLSLLTSHAFKAKRSSKSSKLITEVFSNLIQTFYTKHHEDFEIIFYGNSSKKSSEIISGIGRKFVTSIRKINEGNSSNYTVSMSAIIFVKSFEDFQILNQDFSALSLFPVDFKFLIYIEDLKDFSKLNELIYNEADRYYKPLKYFYFIINSKHEIHLATFEWFTEELCDYQQLRIVDSFKKSSRKWKNELKIEDKFKKFHNCTISMLVASDGIDGYLVIEIDKIIAQRGNFTPKFEENYWVETELTPEICYQFHVVQIVVSIWIVLVMNFFMTQTFTEATLIFAITPAEKYSKWEKLILPFDLQTWIYTMIVFGLAFITTFIINRMSKRVRNLFLGSSAQYPAYNILGTFFGISQTREPEGNFGRIILMIFILFCLIMRTAYQGVLFEMMAADIRKGSPETIDDLKKFNFTVVDTMENYTFESFYEAVNEESRTHLLYAREKEVQKIYNESIRDASKKLAFIIEDIQLHKINAILGFQPKILKERLFGSSAGIAMIRNNFLYNLMDEIMIQLIPSGIPQYLDNFNHTMYIMQQKRMAPNYENVKDYFTLDDLDYGFYIWWISCGISVLVFGFEILIKFGKILVENVRGFIGLYLMLKFIKK